MRNGLYYFVTRIDNNTIRLSENPVAARKAAYINLTGAPTGTQYFNLPDTAVGIEILATLTTSNQTGSGAELSDTAQPWADVIFNVVDQPEALFMGFTNLMPFAQKLRAEADAKKEREQNKKPHEGNGDEETGIPLEVAGCFSINVFSHIVEARIGSTARIFSSRDLLVQSSIEQRHKSSVSSETTRMD